MQVQVLGTSDMFREVVLNSFHKPVPVRNYDEAVCLSSGCKTFCVCVRFEHGASANAGVSNVKFLGVDGHCHTSCQ
jgi:hypothetical protein